MAARIAIRQTGKKIKPYITTAGSVARMKKLQSHSNVKKAQACIANNKGNKTAIRKCMAQIK